jgi:CYTH domain-containing protein/CHAD domain-containing protein
VADEIERKFLVSALPDAAVRAGAERIEQGYVAIGEQTEVRVRRSRGRMWLTAKRGHGETREEHEIALYREQFDALWSLTDGRRLSKSRRRVPLGDGLVAEVDLFEGELSGLVTVEVEFGSAEQSSRFSPPPWFGRELTGEDAYSNQRLASDGLPGHRASASGKDEDGKEEGMSKAYRLKRKEGVADGLRRVAGGRAAKAVERLREAGEDELAPAIHGARKDLKKLRSVLRLLRDDLGRKRYEAENERFRDAARLLSESRDAEVKIETLRELERRSGDAFPAGASLAWFEALEAERDRVVGGGAEDDARAQAEEAARAIEEAAAGISAWPLETGSWRLLEPGLRRSYRKGRKWLGTVSEDGSAENVHELRKRAKDLWYELRLLHDAWPQLLEPSADQAHELADLLGDHHDLAVLAADLDSRAGLVASREEFAALIEKRQAELLAAALDLGARLYAEQPKAFASRLHAYWKAWRQAP